MTTPSQLAELVRGTAKHNNWDERAALISLRAPLGDQALRLQWLALRDALPSFIAAIEIDSAGSDEALEVDREPDPGEQFQILIHKRVDVDTLQLFFGQSLGELGEEAAQVSHVLIADMGEMTTFATYRSRFEAWSLDPLAPFSASEVLPDPRSFASDFTQANAVPADIRPWLVRASPTQVSEAFSVWQRTATLKLMASLSDRVSAKDGALAYGFTGPPACTVQIADGESAHYFGRVQEGAAWIFAEGARDADTRHLLLANEWARTFRRQGLADLGEGALESARGAYSAYVKAGSRETLKALADLRKSIVEETQKISQRAQDLIGAIWKDLAVATVPFVLKVLPDAAKISNNVIAGSLALGAGAFLVFSYAMQLYINHCWFEQAKNAREVWKSALNLVLTKSEVEAFSDAPINTSIDDYKRVRLLVGFLYAALVAILIIFGALNLATLREQAAQASVSAVPRQPVPTNSTEAPVAPKPVPTIRPK